MTYRKNFTLIELLVVFSIFAILATLLMPAVQKTIQQSEMIQCKNKIKQLSVMFFMYADDNLDRLPDGRNHQYDVWWRRPLLPYTGFNNYQDQLKLFRDDTVRTYWLDLGLGLNAATTYAINSNIRNQGYVRTYPGLELSPDYRGITLNHLQNPSETMLTIEGYESRYTENNNSTPRIPWESDRSGRYDPFDFHHSNALNLIFVDGRATSLIHDEISAIQNEDIFWMGF